MSLALFGKREQKYQKSIIHRKLTTPCNSRDVLVAMQEYSTPVNRRFHRGPKQIHGPNKSLDNTAVYTLPPGCTRTKNFSINTRTTSSKTFVVIYS